MILKKIPKNNERVNGIDGCEHTAHPRIKLIDISIYMQTMSEEKTLNT